MEHVHGPACEDDVVIVERDDNAEVIEGFRRENPGMKLAFDDMKTLDKAIIATMKGVYIKKPALVFAVEERLRKLPVVYNSRLHRRVAQCLWRRDPRTRDLTPLRIELSSYYEMPKHVLEDTVVHEYCHATYLLMMWKEIAEGDEESDHGPTWKFLMRSAGKSDRATCVDPEILKQSRQWDRERRERAETRASRRQAMRWPGMEDE